MDYPRILKLNQIHKKWMYYLSSLIFLNSVFSELKVQTAKGILKGQTLKSRDGKLYYSFTGIPYAKPPIGKLRFEAPVPGDPWKGTLDATKSSNICTQKYEISSQEDCLYLNVYTPNINGDFPVMFWIHGGAFSSGDSSSKMFGPDYFMDKNVVLVTINFRLGVLGFLSVEDDVIPGNYGMKDQVLAMRWVKENVVAFGGDPGQVTIFGGSSGGVSAGYHLISPMSKGLFHKAILQSGTPLCRWSTSLPGVSRNRSKIISNLAGCAGKTSEDVLKCLKTLPPRFFIDVVDHFQEWLSFPTILFSPVAERCDSGQESFICSNQLHKFKQISNVPVIIGLNSAEGGMITASLYNDTSLQYPEFSTDFNRLNSIILSYQHFTFQLEEIGDQILKKYFPFGRIGDYSHLKTVKMITDGRYLHGILDMALKLSSPVYFYLYDYQNEFSFNTLYGKCNTKLGITHGDELTSLFKLNTINPKKLNAMDTKVSKLMVNIWSKFASSEIPTIDGTDHSSSWPKFKISKPTILHLNSSNPNVLKKSFEEDYNFWNSLPLLSNLNKITSKTEWTSKYDKKYDL